MNVDRGVSGTTRAVKFGSSGALVVVALSVVLAVLPVAGYTSSRQDGKENKDKKGSGKSAGFILNQDATAEDVGLPLYPGAQRLKDTSDESSAVQMGLWGRSGGFKLVVLKLESSDSPAKIAEFYRKALSKYGQVLDCGKAAAKPEKAATASSDALDCEDDEPVDGSFTLKAGTKERQHVVGVQPKDGHSKIALVYLENPKS